MPPSFAAWLVWAEEFGLGEMELAPDVFWSLTPREFWIKYRGFRRKEDRARAEAIRQALRTSSYKKNAQMRLEQDAQRLTRYPIKAWTLPDGMTVSDMEAVLAKPRMMRTEDDGEGHDAA